MCRNLSRVSLRVEGLHCHGSFYNLGIPYACFCNCKFVFACSTPVQNIYFFPLLWRCVKWRVFGVSQRAPFTTTLQGKLFPIAMKFVWVGESLSTTRSPLTTTSPGKLFPIAMKVCKVESFGVPQRAPFTTASPGKLFPIVMELCLWSTIEGVLYYNIARQAFPDFYGVVWGGESLSTNKGALYYKSPGKLFPVVVVLCEVESIWAPLKSPVTTTLPNKLFSIAVEVL